MKTEAPSRKKTHLLSSRDAASHLKARLGSKFRILVSYDVSWELEGERKSTRHWKFLPIRKMFHSFSSPGLVQLWSLRKRAQGWHGVVSPHHHHHRTPGQADREQVPCTHPGALRSVSTDDTCGNVEATAPTARLPQAPRPRSAPPSPARPSEEPHAGRLVSSGYCTIGK